MAHEGVGLCKALIWAVREAVSDIECVCCFFASSYHSTADRTSGTATDRVGIPS